MTTVWEMIAEMKNKLSSFKVHQLYNETTQELGKINNDEDDDNNNNNKMFEQSASGFESTYHLFSEISV